MIHGAPILKAGFLPFLFLFACRQTTDQEGNNPDPNDLKIVAEYGSGYSSLMSCKYTITGDGKVNEEIDFADRKRKTARLSKQDLADILAKLKEAEFHDLREEYSAQVTDYDTLILAVTQNKKTRKVVLNAPAL
jgi:hypothetical protein